MCGQWFRQKSKTPHGLHRTEALQPANHGPSERFDAVETAGLHAAAASLPSRRGLGDDDRAAGRRHADYEYGLRLNQLDLVTVVALPATVRRSATVPSPQEQLISQSGLPQCVRLSFTGREEEQLCLQHCRTPAVDNDSLEVTTSTRSRTRSSRRDGRCACHMRARRLDDAVDGPRAPQSGAAQQEQPPWLHDVNHTYHRTHLLLSAALHDLTPHLLSIASSGSPECRMRCAIAHF